MKFSIRGLLLITFVVALGFGWLVDHWRAVKREAEWEELFGDVVRLLSKESNIERTFQAPNGGIWSVNRRPDPERLNREVIHLCDWHHVDRDAFAADLLAGEKTYTEDEIADLYSKHLADVEAVQAEQVEQLRMLIRQRNVKQVWVEGLTPEDMPAFGVIVDTVKSSEKPSREILLRIGAPGRLLVSGELAEVLPLDDEKSHAAARPRNGQIDPFGESYAAREKAIATRLLAAEEQVCVIMLGGAHDLASQFDDSQIEYRRIMPKRVKQLIESQR